MILRHGYLSGVRTRSSRIVGESRLEGEDPRSRTRRTATRHDHAQVEMVALWSSVTAISRQRARSQGCSGGCDRLGSRKSPLAPQDLGSDVSRESDCFQQAKEAEVKA